jgi:hypothetical protein
VNPTANHCDLDSRGHAELIGALQIARDKLQAEGLTGKHVQSVLDQIYTVTNPATAGLRITELREIEQPPIRYALVRAAAGRADEIRAYLPDNYELIGRTPIRGTNNVDHLIVGRDVAGWTLDDYVIPRLASGLYYCEEVA